MKRPVVHVIANAHLDPVWLWDAREGHNEGVATCRAMLDLLDANPDLVFTRGEAAIYEHVRRTDPDTFARILAAIAAGRWEPVGGTWIQPDENLPAGELLCRHFDVGQRYFRDVLGARVKVAWQPDTFGHSAGMPEILAAAGIEYLAFMRPQPEVFPLRTPAFWWHGAGGARILAYRVPLGYCNERDEMPRRLAAIPAMVLKTGLRTIGVFTGLGNHGGGPSQRNIDDIRAWAAAHPEFEVRFSRMHDFFAALHREVTAPGAPRIAEVRGEINFCLRGCYASVARLKFPFRRAEDELLRAERTSAVVQAAGLSGPSDLDAAWRSMLFNSFHDILPGSSIERAFDDQVDEVGAVRHTARTTLAQALNQLIPRVRIALPAVAADHPKAAALLVWNPHLRPLRRFVEVEANLDYRPIWAYRFRGGELPLEVRVGGRPVPFQVIAAENDCGFADTPWRKRVLVELTLPAAGWNVVSLAWVEKVPPPPARGRAVARGLSIANEFYRVAARPGGRGIQVWHRGRSLFGPRGLDLVTVADAWGSWGGMGEEPESIRLTRVTGRWRVAKVAVTERGPFRSAMVVRLESARARADLTFRATTGAEEVAVDARVFTDLEAARIKLVLPGARSLTCEVPAGTATRNAEGEIPLQRWVRAAGPRGGFALASDVYSAGDLEGGDLRVTLARATRYCRESLYDPKQEWWRPTVDRGELRGRLLLLPARAAVEEAAEILSQPPVVAVAWENRAGVLPSSGSLASLRPAQAKLLALRPSPAGLGLEVRVRNSGRGACSPVLRLGGETIRLGSVEAGAIATFRVLPPARRGRKVPLGA